MEKGKKVVAIVLAGGQGRRMQSEVRKQYLLLEGKPVLYYSLMAFEQSQVDEIVLVTEKGEMDYCREEIVKRYGFQKVKRIATGGKERYHSVYAGLKECRDCGVVLIHDGARPFLTREMIERSIEGVRQYRACVLGMPVKDTIKICDEHGFVLDTPRRDRVWMVQTPQSFEYALVYSAYQRLMESEELGIGGKYSAADLGRDGVRVTDDAMVVEEYSGVGVRLMEGSYENIKITTPEDLILAGEMAGKYLRMWES